MMNKLPLFATLLVGLSVFQLSYSQDTATCMQDLSIFAEYVKVKNYDAAIEPWIKVRENCPDLNAAIYTYGERIIKNNIKNGNPDLVESSKKELIKLYDEWIQYFPKNKNKSIVGDVIGKKAQALLDYKMADLKKIYSTFNEAYTKDAISFTNPKFLYNYFKTLYDLYKSGDNQVSMEMLINKYEEVSEKFDLETVALAKKLDVILKKEDDGEPLTSREQRRKRIYNINSKAIGTYLSNLDAIIAKEATCENLIPLYKRNFEEFKEDSVWLKRAASRMDSKECSDDPFFVTLVEALHSLDPSADSAYYLGLLNDKRENANEALKYYEESISLETDNYKKAKILLKIANKFTPLSEYHTVANEEALIRKLTIVWGAKESIYKMYAEPGLGFLQHINVTDFDFDDAETTAKVNFKGRESFYEMKSKSCSRWWWSSWSKCTLSFS